METATTIALSAGLTVYCVGWALILLAGPALLTYLLLAGMVRRLTK